jgi:hypothetical protein
MEQPVQLIQTVLQRPVMMVCVVPVMMLLAVEYIVMELLALKAETVLQALVTKEFVLHVWVLLVVDLVNSVINKFVQLILIVFHRPVSLDSVWLAVIVPQLAHHYSVITSNVPKIQIVLQIHVYKEPVQLVITQHLECIVMVQHVL